MTTTYDKSELRVKEQCRDLSQKSLKTKQAKKDYAGKECRQVAKEAASFLCNRQKGLTRIPLSQNVGIVRIKNTCSICGEWGREMYIKDGRKFCRRCK